MPVARRIREEEQARERGPAAQAPAPSVDALLAMQRGAGNQAVGRAIARMTQQGKAVTVDIGKLDKDETENLLDDHANSASTILDSVELGQLEKRKGDVSAADPAARAPRELDKGDWKAYLKGELSDAALGEIESGAGGASQDDLYSVVTRLRIQSTPPDAIHTLLKSPAGALLAADGKRRGLLDSIAESITKRAWTAGELAELLGEGLSGTALPTMGLARLLRVGGDLGKKLAVADVKKAIGAMKTSGADAGQVVATAASFIKAGHTQPGAMQNDDTPPMHDIAEYDIAADQFEPGQEAFKLKIVLPEGKVNHIYDGHSYEKFFFESAGNNKRGGGGGSSLMKPGTDPKKAVIDAVAASGTVPAIWNSVLMARHKEKLDAWKKLPNPKKGQPAKPAKPANFWGTGPDAKPPSTQQGTADYTLAFALLEEVAGTPATITVMVSQFYPSGKLMAEKMMPATADAVGFLLGPPRT